MVIIRMNQFNLISITTKHPALGKFEPTGSVKKLDKGTKSAASGWWVSVDPDS